MGFVSRISLMRWKGMESLLGQGKNCRERERVKRETVKYPLSCSVQTLVRNLEKPKRVGPGYRGMTWKCRRKRRRSG